MNSMISLINDLLQTVRKISSDLRPGILDELGLGDAIEWQAKEFQDRADIHCDIAIDIQDLDLNPNISTPLFRIFQDFFL